VKKNISVLFVSPEVDPLSKTGGLADVSGALPKALAHAGIDVAVATPFYEMTQAYLAGHGIVPAETGIGVDFWIDWRHFEGDVLTTELPGSDVPVWLIRGSRFFDRDGLYQHHGVDYDDNLERFVFFARAVIEAATAKGAHFDVVHVNDWQSSLLPVYLKVAYGENGLFSGAKTLLTIHNLAYQGVFPKQQYDIVGLPWSLFTWDKLEFYDQINVLKGGLVYADAITTVSPTYAKEIQTEEFGCGLEGVLAFRKRDLTGILNGVDYSVWSPDADSFIPVKYDKRSRKKKAENQAALRQECGLPDTTGPLIGIISRLADQKGFDILSEIIDDVLKMDVQMVVLGTGDKKYHDLFEGLQARDPHKIRVFLKFDNRLAHLIEAGSDMFLMPSYYEPCGLNQIYSLKYGTVPIVRETGGLKDTIVNATAASIKSGRANGLSFKDHTGKALLATMKRAVKMFTEEPETWDSLVATGMSEDFSWDKAAKNYIALYEKLVD
jgi:starch synthase